MSAPDVDVLVVGAGPAGALAARELARAGRDVLLVDRAVFPRDKVCGCCVGGAALEHLRAVGLDAPDGLPMERLALHAGGRRAVLGLPAGRVVSRRTLDAALLGEAERAGAAVRTDVSARPGAVEGTARRVHLGDEVVRADLVLLATGLAGAAWFGARPARGSRVGLGAHLPADAFPVAPGTVVMACGAAGYVGLVQDDLGRLDVAAAADPGAVRRDGAATVVDGVLRGAGLPALPDAAWSVTPPLTTSGPCVADRVLGLGDAAGYVEPFTGEGIGWALGAARAVVPLARDGWRPDLARRWPRALAAVRRRRACRATAALLRRPRLVRAVLPLLAAAPGLAAPVVRAVHRS